MTDKRLNVPVSLGELAEIARFPNALARLESAALARKEREAREKAAAAVKAAAPVCVYCAAPAKELALLGRVMYVLRDECCQDRAFEVAAAALAYAERIIADPDEQDEMNARYVDMRTRITRPDLLERLDELASFLATSEDRVLDSGRWPGTERPAGPASIPFAPAKSNGGTN